MRVIFAGGGTGGHLFPGLAIAQEVESQEPGSEILFVTNRGKSKSDLITRYGFEHRGITAERLVGRYPWKIISSLFLSSAGFLESLCIITNFRPDVVVGLGSYVSGPLVVAALSLRKPSIIQEQNYIPGLATRLLSRFVCEVEVSFAETKAFLSSHSVSVTGNPIRKSILEPDRSTGIRNLGLREDRLNLVIFGGSLGAHRINQYILKVLTEIKNSGSEGGDVGSWQIVHITGKDDYSWVVDAYKSDGISAHVFSFVENMGNVYAVADLVICRAGGSTIAELTARGLPAIYIPYPWAYANHQEYNARWVCERGGGELVLDGELESGKLRGYVIGLMTDENRRRKLAIASEKLGKPEAAKLIVQRMKVAQGGGKPVLSEAEGPHPYASAPKVR